LRRWRAAACQGRSASGGGDGPGPDTAHGPRRSASRQQGRLGKHEADPRPGEAEELAHRAQHHQTRLGGQGHQAVAGLGVEKGLVDDQPAAARRQPLPPGEQLLAGKRWASGLLGWTRSRVSAESTASAMAAAGSAHLVLAPGVGMLGVGGRQRYDPAGRKARRQRLDRRLGARHRQQAGAAVIGRGGGFEPVVDPGRRCHTSGGRPAPGRRGG
jgi:hypothetical protein